MWLLTCTPLSRMALLKQKIRNLFLHTGSLWFGSHSCQQLSTRSRALLFFTWLPFPALCVCSFKTKRNKTKTKQKNQTNIRWWVWGLVVVFFSTSCSMARQAGAVAGELEQRGLPSLCMSRDCSRGSRQLQPCTPHLWSPHTYGHPTTAAAQKGVWFSIVPSVMKHRQ